MVGLLMEEWDVEEVERVSMELAQGMTLIKACAAEVAPTHEDAHPVPDVEVRRYTHTRTHAHRLDLELAHMPCCHSFP